MNFTRIAAIAIVFVPVAAFTQNASPSATVTAFYSYDRTHSQILNRRNIDARSRWLTPAFVRELRAEQVREDAESKLHPDEKPWFGDGFKFLRDEEYVKERGVRCRLGMRIIAEQFRKSSAQVTVRFAYAAPCRPNPDLYKFRLINRSGRWLIDEIIGPDGTGYRAKIRPASLLTN